MHPAKYNFDTSKDLDDFFIVLPSNSPSYAHGGEKTLAAYTVKLPRNLSLHGDWYVGLTEITYTKSWTPIKKPYPLGIMKKGKTFDTGLTIPREQTSVQGLIGWINTNLQNFWNDNIKFSRKSDVKKDRPYVSPPDNNGLLAVYPGVVTSLDGKATNYWPDIGEEVLNLLGLPTPLHEHPNDMNSQRIVCGIRKPDLSSGVDALYVYTDIASPTIVGDTFAPILRVVPVSRGSAFGENVDVVYPHPYYHKIGKREFDHITIYIRDGSGSVVPFEFGRVIVTLHFKRWKVTT